MSLPFRQAASLGRPRSSQRPLPNPGPTRRELRPRQVRVPLARRRRVEHVQQRGLGARGRAGRVAQPLGGALGGAPGVAGQRRQRLVGVSPGDAGVGGGGGGVWGAIQHPLRLPLNSWRLFLQTAAAAPRPAPPTPPRSPLCRRGTCLSAASALAPCCVAARCARPGGSPRDWRKASAPRASAGGSIEESAGAAARLRGRLSTGVQCGGCAPSPANRVAPPSSPHPPKKNRAHRGCRPTPP
jgi:hypothetical protein